MAQFTWPVPTSFGVFFAWGMYYKNAVGVRVKAPWNRHWGVDFATPAGTPAYAIGNGVVTRAGWHHPGIETGRAGGFGLMVQYRLDDGSGWIVHGHNSRLLVKVGDRVTQGQQIACTGGTGYSSGPHSHVEWQRVQDSQSSAQDWTPYAVKSVTPPRKPAPAAAAKPTIAVRNLAYGAVNDDVARLAQLAWKAQGLKYRAANQLAWMREPSRQYGPMLRKVVADTYAALHRHDPKAWPDPRSYDKPGLAGPALIRYLGGTPV